MQQRRLSLKEERGADERNSMSKKEKRKRIIRIAKHKHGEKRRFRILILNKEIFGYNSHPLPRALRRKDRRCIRHLHLFSGKIHIPLDLKYIKYVLSDALKRRSRKKGKRDRKKDKRT